ncbi:MAG: ExbD/TolR family protein [Myxococcaceae bacterium]
MKKLVPRSRLVAEGLGIAGTDVVMNLFIFFLIVFALLATFSRQKEAAAQQAQRQEHASDLELPLSSDKSGQSGEGALTVECTREGQVRLDGAPIEREELTAALQKAMAGSKRPIVLRAHKGLELGEAVGVLDLIRAAGPQSVSIATVEAEPRSP